MTEITLSQTETKLLLEAAGRGGSIEFPESNKPSSRERILGRLARDELVQADEAGHHLTAAGYRAVACARPGLSAIPTPRPKQPRRAGPRAI